MIEKISGGRTWSMSYDLGLWHRIGMPVEARMVYCGEAVFGAMGEGIKGKKSGRSGRVEDEVIFEEGEEENEEERAQPELSPRRRRDGRH